MKMRHSLQWGVGALAVAGVVVTVGITTGHPSSSALGATHAAAPSAAGHGSGEAASSSTETFPAVGASLTRAAAAATPGVSGAAAIAAVAKDGVRGDIQATIKPIATLDELTTSALGPTSAGKAGPLGADRLVWDVNFPDAPQRVYGPIGGPEIKPEPCDFHVLVDARTGDVLEAFQAGCAAPTASTVSPKS